MKRLFFVTAITLAMGFSTLVHAALVDNGGGFIYDTDLNITLLQDAYYANTSHYITPAGRDVTTTAGLMTWDEATAWASGLTVGGVTGWRLPRTVDGPYVYGTDGTTTGGYNITSSEMGHLYYIELGNTAFTQSGYAPPVNKGPFADLLSAYWSGTEYATDSIFAWYFHFGIGSQSFCAKDYLDLFALAVHDGDVLGNGIVLPNGPPVPIPGSILLLAPGLVGLAAIRRRLKK